MQGLWRTVRAWIRNWVFPGVWVTWLEVDGTLTVAGQEIEGRSGRAWIGITGFGSLRWCKPLDVIYRTGDRAYHANLTLRPGASYIIQGDQKVIEEVSSGRRIEMFLRAQGFESE